MEFINIFWGLMVIVILYYVIKALIYMSDKNAKFPDTKEYESEIRKSSCSISETSDDSSDD